MKRYIPNTITCLNMLSGTLACVFSFRSQEYFGCMTGYQLVFSLIALAAVFDFFDGFAARLLHATSPIGKELDSLSDLVSFGMAPALLLFNTMLNFEMEYTAYIALLPVIFGGLRLAKFNVDTRQSTSFIGLPIPANAIFWIGYCAIVYQTNSVNEIVAILLIVTMSLLMVSELPMPSLKFKNYRIKDNLDKYALVAVTALLVCVFGLGGLAGAIVFYLLLSVGHMIFKNK